MDQQISQAVDIALSGTADPNLKNQAFDFINQIKSTEEGYKSCIDILLKNSTSSTINEGLTFFIYQVIDENIEKLSQEQYFELNSNLFKTLSVYIVNNRNDAAYLKNKFATLFGKLFCYVYTNIHPTFLKDIINLISNENQLAYDYYTRILISIHSEIGDKFISRSREIQERNNMLKDHIRMNDMNTLVETWAKILSNPMNSDDVLNNALKIVGHYINWMEINLFMSESFINLIFQYLNKDNQKNETCLTLIEIISKKMKPTSKLELISLLNLTSVISSSVSMNNDDLEFLENIVRLINQIGMELVVVLENQPDLLVQLEPQFLGLWPLVFTSLDHEYDDISQQVFPFILQYLLLCKKHAPLNSIELLSTLLNKVILKMKYDDDDDGFDDDSIEQFSEIRQKLKHFQDTIGLLKPELYVEAIPIVINESIFKLEETEKEKIDWRKLELGLFELSNYSDSLRNNVINLPKTEICLSKPYMILQEFMVKLINSNLILTVNHPQIQSNFFEIVVKHYSFLNINSEELTYRILEIFTSPFGLFNTTEKVRLRCWYLFFRFIKLTKPILSNESFIENLLIKIQPLLVVKAELPTKDEDDDLVEHGIFNNQLSLFEAIGLLISILNININIKAKMIDLIYLPLFSELEACIKNANNVNENQQLIALQAHHLLMAIGTFARGYEHDCHGKYSAEVVEKINTAAEVVLITLENFPKSENIREASRFAFARFLPIVKFEIHLHLSKLISLILASNNLKISELSDFLSFVGQIVHEFKDNSTIYQLLNNLLSPLIDKVFQTLNTSSSGDELIPDLVRDKYSLKKAYMTLITSLVINHSSSLLITESNKQKFPEILSSFIEYAYDLDDTSVSRMAITQLINVVNTFGNGGKVLDKLDKFAENLPPIEGIDEFLINKTILLCFELPFQKAEFDMKDAQFRLIAQEISVLLKTYQQVRSEDYLNHLSNYLTNMGLSPDLMNDFGRNLVESDQKAFKKYFITFVTQLKGK